MNTSIRQLDVEIDVSYKTVYRRVQRSEKALDAPRLSFEGPVEIDDRGLGKATYYRLRLPFREERDDEDALRPLHLVGQDGDQRTRSRRVVSRAVLCALLSARDGDDDPVAAAASNEGGREWPPPVELAIERWPWIRSWIDCIARLRGGEGGGSRHGPTPWIDGPYTLAGQFGAAPTTTQTQLTG